MRINKSTGHALRIMLACAAREGQLVKVAEIADELQLTHQNVFKMVHILSQSGLIAAARGRYGGVKLARPASEISVGEIVRAIETIVIDADGEGGIAAVHHGLTPAVAGVLDDALLAFISVLERHSLAEIAALKSKKVLVAGGRAKQAGSKRQAPSRTRVKSASNRAATRSA